MVLDNHEDFCFLKGAFMMFDVKTYNAISNWGLKLFKRDPNYQVNQSDNPDAYITRSVDLHHAKFPSNLKVIGRAGVGYNNLPLEKLAQHGIVAYNTPGSNHNAVKELVIALLIATSRHLFQAIEYTRKNVTGDVSLDPKSDAKLRGTEIKGKTLGVIGVGNVGSSVANAAANLGMKVYAYDPYLTSDAAWKLSPQVTRVKTVDQAIRGMDYVTVHIPKNKANSDFISADKIAELKQGAYLFNYSRLDIVDNHAVEKALDDHHLRFYATDFGDPSLAKYNGNQVIVTPHIGGSTVEGEGNGAYMAARDIKTFLNTGNVDRALNCPDLQLKFTTKSRLSILAKSDAKLLATLTDQLKGLGKLVSAKNQFADYLLVNLKSPLSSSALDKLKQIPGVRRVRLIKR